MSAEHKRPLVAFILVALACAFVVGQAVRDAALRQLVDIGVPLSVLAPIAPDILFTIPLSGKHGRGGDTPYLGHVLVVVAHAAPARTPAAGTVSAVATRSATTTAAVLRTAAAPARTAARHHATTKHARTAHARTPARAHQPATPALAPGASKGHGHAGKVTKRPAPVQNSHARAVTRATMKATHQTRHAAQAVRHRTQQASHPHHATKQHTKKQHHKPHHAKKRH